MSRLKVPCMYCQRIVFVAAPDSDDLIKESVAAKILCSAPGTLRSWRARGLGPPFVQLGPRAVRYSRAAIVSWIANHTVEHVEDEASR